MEDFKIKLQKLQLKHKKEIKKLKEEYKIQSMFLNADSHIKYRENEFGVIYNFNGYNEIIPHIISNHFIDFEIKKIYRKKGDNFISEPEIGDTDKSLLTEIYQIKLIFEDSFWYNHFGKSGMTISYDLYKDNIKISVKIQIANAYKFGYISSESQYHERLNKTSHENCQLKLNNFFIKLLPQHKELKYHVGSNEAKNSFVIYFEKQEDMSLESFLNAFNYSINTVKTNA
jgi:hypothetical protein